ncbi:galactose-binding domain-like protein [Gautieria morchelliformis]|nr:galactose-binding domain-like protein [Gautieria morchelliformis]
MYPLKTETPWVNPLGFNGFAIHMSLGRKKGDWPKWVYSSMLMDLAHVFSGGRAVYTSDQHFGVGSNLLLPGRGKDMGDGWETKRSRERGHNDYVIIRLGQHSGQLDHVEINTNHFKGNYPESCELRACYSEEASPINPVNDEIEWTAILPRHKLGPHRRHFFQLENVVDKYFTHVRVTITPTGVSSV